MISHDPQPWNAILTVAELNERVRLMLEEGFPYLRVKGEIIDLHQPPSGHVYFTLGDGQSRIRAVIWRNAVKRIHLPPASGQAVVATGHLAVYTPRGEYQLIVEGLQPAGQGAERELLLQLHARLKAEGLFEAARKRPLPMLPAVIGMVTSRGGAVLHDVIQVLERRFPGFHLLVAHATVQGEGAATAIAAALDQLNAEGRAEVIICGRGGGSADDLAAFNSEQVVRAIARSRVPVISAVGHEVDLTLADLVADLRAPTPSAAAELALPDRDALLARLATLRQRLLQGTRGQFVRHARGLEQRRLRLVDPRRRIDLGRQRGDELAERLHRAVVLLMQRRRHQAVTAASRLLSWQRGSYLPWQRGRLRNLDERLRHAGRQRFLLERDRLAALTEHLAALSPLAVLRRGFAIVRDAEGRVIRRAGEVTPPCDLTVTLGQGRLHATVTRVEE